MKTIFAAAAGLTLTALVLTSPAQPTVSTAASVQTIVTVEPRLAPDTNAAPLKREDLMVYEGQQRLPVTSLTALTGENAALELYILIDEASASSFGSQIRDVQRFIENQPNTTAVGVGYMRNATVMVAHDLTTDHQTAAKSVRLPMGSFGAMASPYLSLRDLIKRWPQSTTTRREVILIASGADPMGDMGSTNAYLDSAIEEAQRGGVIVYTIYTPIAGHIGHSYWRLTWAQNHLAQLSEETGGETFMLGLQAPVSFAPYLDEIAAHLRHQYRAEFTADAKAKGELRRVRYATEVPNTEIVGASRVYVPAAGVPAKSK